MELEENKVDEKSETQSTYSSSSLMTEDMLAIKEYLKSKNTPAELQYNQNHLHEIDNWRNQTEISLRTFYDKSLYVNIENMSFILNYYSKIKMADEYATLDKVWPIDFVID